MESREGKLIQDPVPSQSLETFLNQEEKYRALWKNKDQSFWVKLIIDFRNGIPKNDFEFDIVFVDILKCLVAKKFCKIFNHISHVLKIAKCKNHFSDLDTFVSNQSLDKQKEILNSLKIVFGGNYTELSVLWLEKCLNHHYNLCVVVVHALDNHQESDLGKNSVLPDSWGTGKKNAEAFEVFLRARWGECLFKMLGCTKEELSWWHSPAQPPWSPPQRLSIKQEPSPNSTELTTYKNKPAKWLPDPMLHHTLGIKLKYTVNELDFFGRLEVLKSPLLMWNLLELAIPPVLAKRFYLLKADLLSPEDMEIVAWFSSWNSGFGIKFLNIPQKMHHENVTKEFNNGSKFSWDDRMLKMKGLLEAALSKPSAPDPTKDCAETAQEFLLERLFLVQLPFRPVLLQQWLAGALLEVMKFEEESMELRHFPLLPDLVKFATLLLTLVRQAKERVLLGLHLLAMQITKPPDVDTITPAMLMDEVILPATATLEFLLSGEAYEVLEKFKKIAWTKSRSLECERILVFKSVPPSAYTVHEDLANMYFHHFWHLNYWIQKEFLLEPYPSDKLAKINITKLLKELKQNKVTPVHQPYFTTQEFSLEEKLVYSKSDMTGISNKNIIEDTQTVFGFVQGCKHFPGRFEKELMTYFKNSDHNEITSEFSIDNTELSASCQAVMYATLFYDIQSCMTNLDKRSSLLSWLVRFSGKVLEQEQIVRLITIASLILKQTPVIPGLLHSNSHGLMELVARVECIYTVQKDRNRSWLEASFPQKWKLPVGLIEKEETEDVANITEIIENTKLCEVQFGRMFYHSTLRNLDSKSVNNIIKLFDFIPNLALCYISNFNVKAADQIVDESLMPSNIASLYIFSKFLVNTLQICHDKTLEKLDVQSLQTVGLETAFSSIFIKLQYYLSEILCHFYSFVNITTHEDLPGYKHFSDPLISWHDVFTIHEDICEEEYQIGYRWVRMSLQQCLCLYLTCDSVWNTHSGNFKAKSSLCNELKDLHFAGDCIACLKVSVASLSLLYPELKQLQEYKLLFKMFTILPKWRQGLIRRLIYAEDSYLKIEAFNEKDMLTFAHSMKDLLSNMMGLIRRIKESLKFITVRGRELVLLNIQIDNIIKQFHTGNIDSIIQTLKLNVTCRGKRQTEHDMQEMALKYLDLNLDLKTCMKPALPKCERRKPNINKCRSCYKVELEKGSFLVCKKCVEEKYPDVNFFCSTPCRDSWWQAEHMAEHLEYELGISSLCKSSN